MIRNLSKNSIVCVLIPVVGVAAALAGCNTKTPAPPGATASKPVAPQAKPVQKQLSSALTLSPPPVNQFDFSNKKDPFKPFVAVKAEPSASEARGRWALKDAIPIHRFDVTQFTLIGVVTGDRENRAMVVDPNHKGYVLKVGMTIGKNEGRVTSITTSGVEVLEQFRDDNGKVRKERIRLTLPRKQ